jgi:hypothetical protein
MGNVAYDPKLTVLKGLSGAFDTLLVILVPVLVNAVIPEVIQALLSGPVSGTIYVAVAVGALRALRNFLKNR